MAWNPAECRPGARMTVFRSVVKTTQLDPHAFKRVHRSTIVRQDMVTELRSLTNRGALLRLRDGCLLRASRTYMPALVNALQHFNKKTA